MAKNPITGLEEDQLKLKSEVKPLDVNVGGEIKPTTTPSTPTATAPKFTQEQEQGFDVLRKQYETQGYTPMQAAELAGSTYVKTEAPVAQPAQEVKPVTMEEPKAVDTTTLSPEEQSYYSAQKNRIDAIAAQKGMSTALKEMKNQISQEKEKKFAKDVEEAMQATKDDAARQAEITRIQTDRDLTDAKNKLAKQAENAMRFKGATGFPQTQAALKAQQDSIDRTRQVIGEMQTISALQKEGADKNLARRMNELQDQLDLNVSKAVQETMTNLQTLISAGELDSVEAIIKAKTDLMEGLNNKYNDFLNNTYEASKVMLDQAEKNLKTYRESTKYNDDFTKQIGDGYMYNNLGQRMVDSSGNPLKSMSVKGKPLSTTPITLNDGSLAMIFQNEDGTLRTEKLEGTKPMQATPQAVAKYADLVSRGAMSVDDLRQLGFSRGDINAIVSLVTPETTTKLKNVTIKDAEGNEIPASYNETTGEYTVGGQVYSGDQIKSSGGTVTTGGFQENMNVKRTGGNVGKDTNNPGNITADSIPADRRVEYGQSIGAVGTYTSPNGRTYYVFPDMNTGLQASVKDISSKIAGGSSWATPQTTLSDFVKGWTVGPNAKGGPSQGYLAQVMKATGATANTPIGQINPTLLAQGIANGEGVDVTKNANIPVSQQVGGDMEFTNEDITVFDRVKQAKTTKEKKEILSSMGYKYKDYIDFETEIKNREDKYRDLSGAYNNLLGSLGSGVSDADREIMMKNYYTGLYKNDPELIKTSIRDSLVKNKDYGKAISSFNELMANMTRLSNGLNKYVSKGGDTNIFEGTAEQISQKLGATTDTDLAEIKAGLDIMLSSYLKAQSGVGVSDKEREFLQGIMPSINNLSNLNGAKIKALAKSSKDSLTSVIKTPFIGRENIYDEVIAPNFKIEFTSRTDKGVPLVDIKYGKSISGSGDGRWSANKTPAKTEIKGRWNPTK